MRSLRINLSIGGQRCREEFWKLFSGLDLLCPRRSKLGTALSRRMTNSPFSVECLACMDDIPISKAPKLRCGHRMCHPCLKRIFDLSVTDPQHMPPKCCSEDHIPLKHVDKLFDLKFKKKWNKKYHEYTTKNRLYCPKQGCGNWIKPSHIYVDTSGGAAHGRKYGLCDRCRTKVCKLCNQKWHVASECPKDEATLQFVEKAKEEGWQKCYNCSAMVELKEGCNHMTCRCTAEFCMICGAKWKTCDCPWFNYEAVEADRLQHMNLPRARRAMANGEGARQVRYQQELANRRRQEREDEAIAFRMQRMAANDDDDVTGGPLGRVIGIGNAAGHHLNEDFVRQAANILAGNARQADAEAERLWREHILPQAHELPSPPLSPQSMSSGSYIDTGSTDGWAAFPGRPLVPPENGSFIPMSGPYVMDSHLQQNLRGEGQSNTSNPPQLARATPRPAFQRSSTNASRPERPRISRRVLSQQSSIQSQGSQDPEALLAGFVRSRAYSDRVDAWRHHVNPANIDPANNTATNPSPA